MINLYDKNTEYETVTNNGYATLQPMVCELKVAINGTWQLYMELPYDKEGKYKLIQPDMLLRVTDINCINPSIYESEQFFRIADCKKLDATMQVIAYPVGMDARFDTFVHKMDLTGMTASNAISTINGVSNKYAVTTNLTNQKAIGDRIYENQNIIAILNGDDGFTESWGGEIVYDNNSIKVRDNCGTSQTGDVRYGKNIASMTYDYDTSNVVTRIYPKSKNGDILNDVSQYKIANTKYVDSPHFNEYPFARIYYMQAPYTLTQTKNDGSDTYALTAEALAEIQDTVYADLNSMFGDYADAELLRNIDITFFKETYNKTADKDGFKGLAELYWENLCDKTSAQYGHKVLSDEFKGLLKTAVNNAFKSFWTGTAIKYIWKEYVGGYRYELQNPFASKQAELDYKSTWVKKGSAWWYINAEGYHTASSRVDTGTWKWYKPSTGGTLKLYGNKSKSRYIQNQLVKLDGIWYLFGSEGTSVSGTTNIYSELRNSLLGTLFDYPSDTTANASVDYEGQLFNLLYTHMTTYIQNMYSNTNIDEPTQTISVNMVDIQNALGYSNYKDLLRLHLGDTVNCINNKTGVASQSRIIELTYDVLRKYNSNVVIGTASSSVVDILRSIGGQSDDVQLVAGDGISIQNNVISVTNQQTGVQDVQVNGESVVDGKIAYIDINNTALEYFIETENALYGMQEIEWIIRDRDFKWGNGHLQCVEDSEWRYFEITTAVTPRGEDSEGVVMFIRESEDNSYPFYIHSLQHDWSHGGLLYLSKNPSAMVFDIDAGYYDLNRNTGQAVSGSGSGAYSGGGAYETPTAITITDGEGRTLFGGNEIQGAISSTSIDGETWYGCYIWQASRTYQFSSNHCIDEYLPASEIPESGYATLADAMNAIIPLYKTGDGKKSGISRYDNLAFFAGADDDLGTNAPIKIWNDGTYQGLDKVEDVRVNNTSVVSDKIANIDLSDYVTDSELEDALDDKQDVLTAGENITIEDNVISATGGGGGSNARELTKAEYDALSDAEKKNGTIYFIKDMNPPSGGGSNTVIINGQHITSFGQEVYSCSTPFADVCKALKDGMNVNLSIINDFAHTFGNIGDYFEFKRMEVDVLSEEIISITFERLYKKSSTTLCNDTIIYSATDTNNEHTLIKTEWTFQ